VKVKFVVYCFILPVSMVAIVKQEVVGDCLAPNIVAVGARVPPLTPLPTALVVNTHQDHVAACANSVEGARAIVSCGLLLMLVHRGLGWGWSPLVVLQPTLRRAAFVNNREWAGGLGRLPGF
jgi:hypothetical protein